MMVALGSGRVTACGGAPQTARLQTTRGIAFADGKRVALAASAFAAAAGFPPATDYARAAPRLRKASLW